MTVFNSVINSIVYLHNHYCDIQDELVSCFGDGTIGWTMLEERKGALKQVLLDMNAISLEYCDSIGFGRIEVKL